MAYVLLFFLICVYLAQSDTLIDVKNRFRDEITSKNDVTFYGIALSEAAQKNQSPILALTVGLNHPNKTIIWPVELETGIYATIPKQVIQMATPKQFRRIGHSNSKIRSKQHSKQSVTKKKEKETTVKIGSRIASRGHLEMSYGTVGFFVTVLNEEYLITNEHVVGKDDTAVIGEGKKEVEIGKAVKAEDTLSVGDDPFHVDVSIIKLNAGVRGSCADDKFKIHDHGSMWGSKWDSDQETSLLQDISRDRIGVVGLGAEKGRRDGYLKGFGDIYIRGKYSKQAYGQILVEGVHSFDSFGEPGDSGMIVVLEKGYANDNGDAIGDKDAGQVVGLFWGGDSTSNQYCVSAWPKVKRFIAAQLDARDDQVDFC